MSRRRRTVGPRFAKALEAPVARRRPVDPELWKRVRADVNVRHPHEKLARRTARAVKDYEQQGGTWKE